MNIIFGKQEAEKLNEKYIVLELDTVTIKSSDAITAYSVVVIGIANGISV